MKTFIAIIIIAAILFLAVRYIIKEKNKGTKCIGCPHASQCSSKNGGSCGGSCSCH